MSTHEEIEARNARIDAALWLALNAAAPDEESWKAGEEAFNQEGYADLDEQLTHALDAAAPDEESFKAGWKVFHDNFEEDPHPQHSGGFMDKIRSIPGRFTKQK